MRRRMSKVIVSIAFRQQKGAPRSIAYMSGQHYLHCQRGMHCFGYHPPQSHAHAKYVLPLLLQTLHVLARYARGYIPLGMLRLQSFKLHWSSAGKDTSCPWHSSPARSICTFVHERLLWVLRQTWVQPVAISCPTSACANIVFFFTTTARALTFRSAGKLSHSACSSS